MILLNQGRGTYSNKGQLNLSVNKINSIVDISKILLISKSSLLSPNSKIFVIVESLCLKMVPLCLKMIYLVKQGFPCTMMIGAVKEEVSCCFNTLATITRRG